MVIPTPLLNNNLITKEELKFPLLSRKIMVEEDAMRETNYIFHALPFFDGGYFT